MAFLPVRINIYTSQKNESYNGLSKFKEGIFVVALSLTNTGPSPINFPGYFTLQPNDIKVIAIPAGCAFVGTFTWTNVKNGTVSLEINETVQVKI